MSLDSLFGVYKQNAKDLDEAQIQAAIDGLFQQLDDNPSCPITLLVLRTDAEVSSAVVGGEGKPLTMPDASAPHSGNSPLTAEHRRLSEPSHEMVAPWRKWGPYVCERAWGTVREDYSPDGDAWDFLTHDLARSKAYRWGEDGIAGICDRYQFLVFALALLERARSDPEGALLRPDAARGQSRRGRQGILLLPRHTPTHSYMRMLYKYPQRELSLRTACRRRTGAAADRRIRSSSCSTPASSTTTATSTSSSSTRRPVPEDICIRDRSVQSRTGRRAAAPHPAPLVSQHLGVDASRAAEPPIR